jgi:hypothetical protein
MATSTAPASGIERDLAAVQERRTDTLSADAIGDGERQLRPFYVLACHLKDDLIVEASATASRKPPSRRR